MASANIWITRMCVCHPKYLCLRIVACVHMCVHTYLLLLNVPRCRAVLLATSNNKYSYSLSAVCFCIYHFTLCLLLPLLDSINRSCRLPKEFLYVGTFRVGYSFPFWLSTLPYPCIAVSPAVLVVIEFEEHMWLMRTVLMFDFRPELVGSDRVVFNCHCSSYANFTHLQLQFGRLPGKPNKILIY